MKAYILKIDTPVSNEYASICAESCRKVNLEYVVVNGFQNMSGRMAFRKIGLRTSVVEEYQYIESPSPADKAMCCTAGHFAIWKAIADGPDEVGVILEHDAIMLHPITINIPDNEIVTLGYKLQDPSRYDSTSAGPPTELIKIAGHEGAHAYAMTKKTAQILIDELLEKGVRSAVDNDYFILNQRRTVVPLSIASPTPAMGWLRKSTIWTDSAARNYNFIPSFSKYYK